MNDRSKLFEEFYELCSSLQTYHAKIVRFNLPPWPVRLDVERNLTIFQSISCFRVFVLLLPSFVCSCLAMLLKLIMK